MKIRAMIADDESLAREELAFLLSQEEDFELCPSAENGSELLDLYQHHRPDVVFLDIHMPVLSGVEAAKELWRVNEEENRSAGPLIVFTTAHEGYAIEAFSLEALDYLLKPYEIDRFQQAITRIRKHMATRMGVAGRMESPADEASPPASRLSKLLVDDGQKVTVVPISAIQFALRSERFIEIHTEEQKIAAKWTLQDLENKMKGHPFFRSHRSYLVNLDYVQEVIPWFNGAYTIVLRNKEKTKIPVSRLAVKTLFELLEK